jgi:hypothetical protein
MAPLLSAHLILTPSPHGSVKVLPCLTGSIITVPDSLRDSRIALMMEAVRTFQKSVYF